MFTRKSRGYFCDQEHDNRQCREEHRVFLAAILLLVFPADALRHGRPLHHRPVRGSGEHHGCFDWQSGHAHADRHDCGASDGHDCYDCTGCRRGGPPAHPQGHRHDGCAVLRRLTRAGRAAGRAARRNHQRHGNTDRGCIWHTVVSPHLLLRHPTHHRLQHHRIHLPRPRRRQESDVLRRSGLPLQHRTRLPLHGRHGDGPERRSLGHRHLTGHQRRARPRLREERPSRHCTHTTRLPPGTSRAAAPPAHRRADLAAGRFHPGRLPCHHCHREYARPD